MRKNVNRCQFMAISAILCLIMAFAACAAIQTTLSSDDRKYLAAREEFNNLLEQYIQMQDTISDSTHEKIKTAFIAGDSALDAWSRHLDTGQPYQDDILLWGDAIKIIKEVVK